MKLKRPLIIAGPCSVESCSQTVETCKQLAALGCVDILRGGVWKPRTKPGGFEGSGVRGLEWLAKAGKLTGLPVMVEVATTDHVEKALKHDIDMFWIGARTTGSPFCVQEIAQALRGTGKPIFIKNPMNPDVDLWCGAVERFSIAGCEDISLIHRGFSAFAGEYRNQPMWHLAIEMRRRFSELTMICDPSHICGNRTLLSGVTQKCADIGFDGVMIESHIDPDKALSDSAQQITPQVLGELLSGITWRDKSADSKQFVSALEQLRTEMDIIDSELMGLLSRRMAVADRIGEVKRANNVAILQNQRWQQVVERVLNSAEKLNLSPEFLKIILDALHIESIDRQNKIMNKKSL